MLLFIQYFLFHLPMTMNYLIFVQMHQHSNILHCCSEKCPYTLKIFKSLFHWQSSEHFRIECCLFLCLWSLSCDACSKGFLFFFFFKGLSHTYFRHCDLSFWEGTQYFTATKMNAGFFEGLPISVSFVKTYLCIYSAHEMLLHLF